MISANTNNKLEKISNKLKLKVKEYEAMINEYAA